MENAVNLMALSLNAAGIEIVVISLIPNVGHNTEISVLVMACKKS